MSDNLELAELEDWNTKSTNHGGGIELLMNDRVIKENGPSHKSTISLDDLTILENDLNDTLSVDNHPTGTPAEYSFKPKSSMFDAPSSYKVSFDDDVPLGRATADSGEDAASTKTWDGFGKFNIPFNPDKHVSPEPKLTNDEILREKFKLLKKFEEFEKKGISLSKRYDMESSLSEMKGEYEIIKEDKEKQNSVKFQGSILSSIIYSLEYLNSKYDPFDIKLDGWNEQFQENINDYDDIFAELHEKYKSKASVSPELKLLFQLGSGAMMVHLSNSLFKNAMPNMDDILKQNPDLMKSFQSAAINSMSQSAPGFAGFMNNVANPHNNNNYNSQYNNVSSRGGPPPPVATQGPDAVRPPTHRPGNNNYTSRPDLNYSKSNFAENDGIRIQQSADHTTLREYTSRRPDPATGVRPEMKGPDDISDILSGLKTKTINIHEQSTGKGGNTGDNASTISVSDLKELKNAGNVPKQQSKRRKKSPVNTVSLDI